MLDVVTDPLNAFLTEAFPPARYPREALRAAPMPPLIAHFLGRSLEHRYMLDTEPLRTFQSEWMNTGRPEVHEALKHYLKVLSAHAHVPRKAWERLLQQAIQKVTSYLVRPVDTLVDFVFSDETEDVLALYVVHRRMGYFAAYPYLHAAVQAYTERKHLPEIDRTRFASFLTRIDQQMTEDHDADAWLHLFEPLFSLLRAVPASNRLGGIPAPLLQAFFEAKGAQQPLAQLARAGDQVFDEAALRQLLSDTPEAVSPEAVSPEVVSPEAVSPEAAADPTVPAEAQQETALPLWKRFQQRRTPPAGEKQITLQAAAVSDRPPPSLPVDGLPEDTAVPLWMKYRTPVEEDDGEELNRLSTLERTVLGKGGYRNRDWFTRHLFSGSTVAYENGLLLIQGAATWADASQVIAEEVFKKHQVNIYSPVAVSFTNAIEARYQDRLKVKG